MVLGLAHINVGRVAPKNFLDTHVSSEILSSSRQELRKHAVPLPWDASQRRQRLPFLSDDAVRNVPIFSEVAGT